jgi:hypothetical protein
LNQIVKLADFRPVASAADFGLEGSKVDFVAATRPLQIVGKAGGILPVDSHKAVLRMIDDKPVQLGIVGSDFKLLQHRDFFEAIEKKLRESIRPDLQRDPQVKTSVSFDGAWAKREYVFPAFAEALEQSPTLKAKLGYRVIAWNALDGSSVAGMLTGLIDFYCTNGVILGSLVGKLLRRHTSGLNLPAFEQQIAAGVGEAQKEVRYLEEVARKPLDLQKAQAFLKDAGFSERATERLIEQTQREVAVRGDNLFALVSALTYYSSHADDRAGFGVRDTGSDHVAKTLHGRELEVHGVLHSNGFRQLLAA